MKKIMYFLLCMILCIGIGGSAFILYKNFMEDEPSTTQKGDAILDDGKEGITDFEEPSADSSDSSTPLIPPANEVLLIADGMEMVKGASVYVGDDESLDPAIRFMCLIDNDLKAEVEADENKSLAILVAPLDYFDAVNTDASTYVDWINAFADAGKTTILSVFDGYGAYNGYTSYMRFTLSNVLYKNMNRKFVAMGVLIDNSDGTPVYQYSAMPKGETYRTNARSVANVTGAALNAYAIGEANFSEKALAKLKTHIDMAIDQTNGLSAYVANGDMPEVTITSGTSVVMALNGSHTITGEFEPTGLDVPVRFKSSDENVVTVSETGIIHACGAGSAKVTLYIAGQAYPISVTCSNNGQYV